MAKQIQTLEIRLEIYDHFEDLEESDQVLMTIAREAAANSHSPYSGFKVGAAIRLSSGRILTACNQENMAFPAGQCAESICMFSAGVHFPNEPIIALAVTTPSGEDSDDLLTPCGVCRQVISEYRSRQDQPIRIMMRGARGPVYVAPDIQALLPLMFEHQHVKSKAQSP